MGSPRPHLVRQWTRQFMVVALCVLGVVAMTTSTGHLQSLGPLALSSHAVVLDEIGSSAAHVAAGETGVPRDSFGSTGLSVPTPEEHSSHGSTDDHWGGAHLMMACMLVVAAVATLVQAPLRRPMGASLSAPEAGAAVPFTTDGTRPPVVLCPHDRLCVLLR